MPRRKTHPREENLLPQEPKIFTIVEDVGVVDASFADDVVVIVIVAFVDVVVVYVAVAVDIIVAVVVAAAVFIHQKIGFQSVN